MTASTDHKTDVGLVTLRYWASARAAAGTDSDAVQVAGPVPLAELIAARPRGPRGLLALLRRARLLLGDGGRPAGHDRRPGNRDRACPARRWSSCRPSPAAEHSVG